MYAFCLDKYVTLPVVSIVRAPANAGPLKSQSKPTFSRSDQEIAGQKARGVGALGLQGLSWIWELRA